MAAATSARESPITVADRNKSAAEDESLIKEPYLDSLIKINQEGLRKARAGRKRERDSARIYSYLRQKFPYAKPDSSAIPEKEFPIIARKAKNFYVLKTALPSLWALASFGGVSQGILWMVAGVTVSAGLFFGGFGVSLISGLSLVLAIKKTVQIGKILFGCDYYHRW